MKGYRVRTAIRPGFGVVHQTRDAAEADTEPFDDKTTE